MPKESLTILLFPDCSVFVVFDRQASTFGTLLVSTFGVERPRVAAYRASHSDSGSFDGRPLMIGDTQPVGCDLLLLEQYAGPLARVELRRRQWLLL
jgi:hypothetical protein